MNGLLSVSIRATFEQSSIDAEVDGETKVNVTKLNMVILSLTSLLLFYSSLFSGVFVTWNLSNQKKKRSQTCRLAID